MSLSDRSWLEELRRLFRVKQSFPAENMIASSKDTAPEYRRGYSDESALTRRQSAQSNLLPGGTDQQFTGQPDHQCLIDTRMRRSEKQRERSKARKELK